MNEERTFLVPLQDRLTDRQAAEYLGVSAGTLRNWRSEERGPVFYRVRRRVFYLRRDLEAYLACCRTDCHALSSVVMARNGEVPGEPVSLEQVFPKRQTR